MSQGSQIVKYRPETGSPFPFPKSGSDWTIDEIKYIGVDHKLDCDLDDIIPPEITLSPKIAAYLNERLGKPWKDLLISRLREDRETFYARLLQVADPQVNVGPYDIPSSSPPSECTPLETQEPRTPEDGSSPGQPSRQSPQRRFRHGSLCSSPASPTPKRMSGARSEPTPETSSDGSYEPPYPERPASDSGRKKEKDQTEKDVEALAKSLLYLIENALSKVLPSLVTDSGCAYTVRC